MNVLQKPIISEKMTRISESIQQYGFIVNARANKLQIREAVEKFYDVKVASVNTMRFAGKNRMRYTQTGFTAGKTRAYKKAIVTLKEGNTIDFFSNV